MFPTKETVSHSEISLATRVYFYALIFFMFFVCLPFGPRRQKPLNPRGTSSAKLNTAPHLCHSKWQERCHNSFTELFRENSLISATLLGRRLQPVPSGKHELPTPLDMAADRLKFSQDAVGEGLEGRGSWAHVAWKAARARLSVSPRGSGRDPDILGSLQMSPSSG